MARFGHRPRSLIAPVESEHPFSGGPLRNDGSPAQRFGYFAIAVIVPLLVAVSLWGFYVDDAWIAVRYAENLRGGRGYVFNPSGPPSDGVTPLVWTPLLALLAGGDAHETMLRARFAGLVALTCACGITAYAAGRVEKLSLSRALVLTLGLSTFSAAAYASSGMETPWAMLFCAAALWPTKPWRSALLAGLAALFRPELIVWSACFALLRGMRGGPPRGSSGRWAVTTLCLALGVSPALAVALTRAAMFGHPYPLSVAAKRGVLEQGLAYAGAGCFFTMLPLVILSWLAFELVHARLLARITQTAPLSSETFRHVGALFLPALAHVIALVLVGGDWMPFARLFVPILPTLAFATTLARPRVQWLICCALFCGHGWAHARFSHEARSIAEHRAALERDAAPHLGGRVASVDIGWVGVSQGAPHVIDLAGLTDPEVAFLPGSHTSKRIDVAWLLAQRADTLLLYVRPGSTSSDDLGTYEYARAVDVRLARDPLLADRFRVATFLPLQGAHGYGYLVLRARP
jgi:hypothetical protein